MTPILQARGLVKAFGRPGWFGGHAATRAVDGVDLAILRGETFAIVGESGCGKSTLARLLVRLIEPCAGEVLLEGRSISRLPPGALRRLRRDLQFVFQDPFSSLNPRMTVEGIVGEPIRRHARLSGAALRARVAALLRLVGLRPEHAGRYPHEFSGGERQRIGIARALASGPKVLVADEPVSALDLSTQGQILGLLQELKAELGMTLVVISHDLPLVLQISDRVGVMYLGQMVEVAPAPALFESPRHPYSQALLAAMPARRGPGRALALAGEMPDPSAAPAGCRLHPRCPFARRRCAIEAPVAEGVQRTVACHYWREIAASDEAWRPCPPDALSPAAARRVALFRAGAGAAPGGKERRHGFG